MLLVVPAEGGVIFRLARIDTKTCMQRSMSSRDDLQKVEASVLHASHEKVVIALAAVRSGSSGWRNQIRFRK